MSFWSWGQPRHTVTQPGGWVCGFFWYPPRRASSVQNPDTANGFTGRRVRAIGHTSPRCGHCPRTPT